MRGEAWTVAGAGYASKPRPAVVIQSDRADLFDSIVVCLLTSDDSIDAVTRVSIAPSEGNGLKKACSIMADKIVTLKKSSLGKKVGVLDPEDLVRMDAALRATLDL